MGCDGDGDGCSRAELRLDEIARGDRSVDARWPSRKIVRPPDHATVGQGICQLPVLRHVRQALPVWQGRYGRGRPWEPSRPDRTGDDASEKFGKGSIERRDRQIDEGTDQTAGAFRPDRIVRPFDCPADRSSLRKAAITWSWSARFAESPAWSPLSDLP